MSFNEQSLNKTLDSQYETPFYCSKGIVDKTLDISIEKKEEKDETEYSKLITQVNTLPAKYFNIICIMLGGKQRVGKTTASVHMQHEINNFYQVPCLRYALSTKLKDITNDLCILFDVNVGSFHDEATKINNRRYLQQIGTNIMRKHFGDEFWCEVLYKRIIADVRKIIRELVDSNGISCSQLSYVSKKYKDRELYTPIVVIIEDTRYQNEINYFKQQFDKAISVIIERPDVGGQTSVNHSSEQQTLDGDVYINNSFDLNRYFAQLNLVLLNHVGPKV